MNKVVIAAVLCLLALAIQTSAQQFSNKGKKIIEYGWDVRNPAYVRDNVDVIEKYPFEGLVMTTAKNLAFDTNRWTPQEIQTERDAIKAIKWKKFTDNFLILHSANHSNMDWFNDEQWKIILANAQDFASIAKAGKCAGIIFDPEAYGRDPWIYPSEFGDHSLGEASAQLKKRGKQWIQALQKGWPDMKLLLFFFSPNYDNTLGAFCTGLIEGAKNNVKIINGNENSYYHTNFQNYVDDWNNMVVRGAKTIEPKLKKKYEKHFQAGMALYMDQTLSLREPRGNFISFYMSPEDRLKFFEATTYWALKTTDEYVWCYSERLDWWKGTFPIGADDAIRSAKAKFSAGESLGYSMEARVNNAKRDHHLEYSKQIVNAEVEISRIQAGVAAPTIDGVANDEVWQNATTLSDFVPTALAAVKEAPVRTTTKVTYDDSNLYVLFHNQEADMSKLSISGIDKDSDVWRGDTAELFISMSSANAYDYRHFMLNANNVQWDGSAPPETNDVSWDANWKSGVAKDTDSWTVEMAIPWSAIGGKPAPGSFRFANLCRQSIQSGWSTWSTVVDGFLDAARFGRWIFAD